MRLSDLRPNPPPPSLVSGLYRVRGAGLRAAAPALALYRRRYRGVPTVTFEPMAAAAPRVLEGYTDRPWYRAGETAAFHLRSPFAANELVVERVSGPERYDEVARVPFGASDVAPPPGAARHGCQWPVTLRLPLPGFRPGYYRATLHAADAAPDAVTGSAITFLVGPAESDGVRPPVAVLAPVSTWLAYNPYGGQSLYHNERDRQSVHVVSALRPNPALGYAPVENIHALRVEAHGFNWLSQTFGADLYPDTVLATPETLAPYRLLVLSYHVEYVTAAMYAGLRRLVGGGRSLLSLGANQVYWATRGHDGHTRLEVRKDGARLSDGSAGGRWAVTPWPEDEWLGGRYSPPGTGTYAPFRVTDPGHWLYGGLPLRAGDRFGEAGMTPLPICGDETDRPTWLSALRAETVAWGLNRSDAVRGPYTTFVPGDAAWDGSGGGAISLVRHSERHASLSTGAIHSASGLGVCPVFTRVVETFARRYGAG